jgi:4-hydroxybenzoate polyprenyltransferase
MRRLLDLAVKFDLWSAAGVGSLVAYAGSDLPLETLAPLTLLAAAGTVVIYNLDHLRDGATEGPRRQLVAAGAATMLLCGATLPAWTIVACLAPGAVGLAYAGLKARVPALKSFLVAAAVALAASSLPLAAQGEAPWPPDPLLFTFLLVFVAVNTHALDLVDHDSDRAGGIRTLPVDRGVEPVRKLFTATAAAAAALLVYASPLQPAPEMPLSLLAMTLLLRGAGPHRDRDRWRLLLDGCLMLPWLLTRVVG